ncbi:MAG: TetR/AcrR family transcriptional regulator [Chloroflexota bacterium]
MSQKLDSTLFENDRRNNVQSGDRRVKRTQQMLQQAFMELVVEEGFNSMTVQILAERAMINRATFYRHYDDIYDLAEKVFLKIIDEHLVSVQAFMPGHPIETLQRMFEHCAAYAPFYLSLLSEMPRFQELVRETIEKELVIFFKTIGVDEEGMTIPLPILLRYWSTAQMGIVQWWLESGQTHTSLEMAQYLWQLFENGPVEQLQLPKEQED